MGLDDVFVTLFPVGGSHKASGSAHKPPVKRMDVLGSFGAGPMSDQLGATPDFALWRFGQNSFEDSLSCPGECASITWVQ
jgi:hypothetical protein